MLISATSALVLNWTSKEIWKTSNARNYFDSLDLSEGDDLFQEFSELENYMLTQGVTNRKYFVRKQAVAFLERCHTDSQPCQVIILAAGISPLSVELATLFPGIVIFDVDKHGMKEKSQFLKNLYTPIRFVTCDITDIGLLDETLKQYGWNPADPTLVIIEGIVYYLTESDLKNILGFFGEHHAKLIGDFVLKPEYVHENNRVFGVEVFRKIKEFVGLDFVNFYSPDHFMSLLRECGFSKAQRFTMDEIQWERTGKKEPFALKDSGWITLVTDGLS